MNLYKYLENKLGDEDAEMRFASLVAKRALNGGNTDQLLDIVNFFGSVFSSSVQNQMEYEDGCQLLRLRLWMSDYSIYSISDEFVDWMDQWQNADDSEKCISYLSGRGLIKRCDDCGEWEIRDELRTTWGSSDYICRSCIDNNYVWSNYYDEYVYADSSREALDHNGRRVTIHEDDDNFYYDDDRDEWVHTDFDPGSQIIGSYHSSKGNQRPQVSDWTKMKKRYLGVELEVECRDVGRGEKAQQLHEIINNEVFASKVFFENDGSLNNGFEIISQPMGLDRHREVWQWLNDKSAVKGLRSHNTTTCGLHVHVSRENLSKLQIAKIVSFINDPENEQLVRAVARRYAEGYCKIKVKKIGQSAQSEDRYEAVNITPRKTIEFRIFKGSLKYESVMSAIQFCNSLVDFCGRANTSIRDLKADNFLDFIRADESGDTDILVPYLENRLELA